ncbi:MAG: ABC transporter ATP-binding protein/permease [Defluviitaleaceae bacterium]|nr:ABC transporter ATP-binding protein/permease [Defluviitaleaceae bacterium]
MKKYLHILIKRKKTLSFYAILSILSSIVAIISIYYSGIFIDILISTTEINDIILFCLIILAISIVNLVIRYFVISILGPLKENVVYDFKFYILNHIRKISILDYKKYNPSYLSKRIEEDSRQITNFFIDNYTTVFVKTIEIFVVSFLVFNINLGIGLTMLLILPAYFYLYKIFQKHIFEKSLLVRESSANFFRDYTYQLEDMEDTIIKANDKKSNEFVEDSFNTFWSKYRNYTLVNANLNISQGFIISLMQIIIFFVGGISVLNGNTTVGMLSILMIYFNQVLNNISYYLDLAKKYQVSKSALHRIDEIIDIPVVLDGYAIIENLDKLHANLTYSIGNKVLFSGLEIEARKGELICIKGKNGSGKSTLLKLLIGIINNENSNIIFNGKHDIKDIDSFKFRNKLISYVPQKIFFRDIVVKEIFSEILEFENFDDLVTLLNSKNVLVNKDYYNSNREHNYAIKEHNSANSNICDFLFEVWDKNINNLSGGDKQLISILCGSLKESDLFILDEPTSNLDTKRIEWFNDMLNSIKKDKIIFIVSHDTDNDLIYDKIIYLE